MSETKTVMILFNIEFGPCTYLSTCYYDKKMYDEIIEFMQNSELNYPYQLLPEDYYSGDQTLEFLSSRFSIIDDIKTPYDRFIDDYCCCQILDTVKNMMVNNQSHSVSEDSVSEDSVSGDD